MKELEDKDKKYQKRKTLSNTTPLTKSTSNSKGDEDGEIEQEPFSQSEKSDTSQQNIENNKSSDNETTDVEDINSQQDDSSRYHCPSCDTTLPIQTVAGSNSVNLGKRYYRCVPCNHFTWEKNFSKSGSMNSQQQINKKLKLGCSNQSCKESANKSCPNVLCISCCGNLKSSCNVASHRAKKCALPTVQQIANAIIHYETTNNTAVLYCRYNGGSNPGTVRAIYPVSWRFKPSSFNCWDDTSMLPKILKN
jgi:hypothetical protein